VLVEQKSILDLRNALSYKYFGANKSEQETVLFLSNYVFDSSVEQLVLSILSGNKLFIPSSDFLTNGEFYEEANVNHLTYISGTPSVLHQIDLSRLKHLKIVTAAGEEFPAHQFRKMRKSFDGIINNAYGITKTTVYNIVSTYSKHTSFDNTLHQLLPLTKAYVLNNSLQLLPVNAIGELYLAGDCVARGYFARHQLTSERFIVNPFRTKEEIADGHYSRMYRTGDLVLCRRNGQLEYIGRDDEQVKLNGYRIELGEMLKIVQSLLNMLLTLKTLERPSISPVITQAALMPPHWKRKFWSD
jgi:N-(5-amino-5-carboxypentanoyl)-L-cysteinyl-D-valine synthase